MITKYNLERIFFKAIAQPGYALATLKKRAAVYGAFKRGAQALRYPESITLYLTHRCNLHCRMCGQWGDAGVRKVQKEGVTDLPLSLIERLMQEVAAEHPSITLFGGEPMLHPDCIAIVRLVKQLGMHCLMISNGTLLADHAAELIDAGLDELNLSVDAKGDAHDEIRGMPGLFDALTSALEAVHAAKAARRAQKPLINLQCTISSHNYTRLSEMADVARALKADSITFHHRIYVTQDALKKQRSVDQLLAASSRDWEGFATGHAIVVEDLIQELHAVRSRAWPCVMDTYPRFSDSEIRAYYRDPQTLMARFTKQCLSPWTAVYVFPDASVRPCLNSTYSFGTYHEKPLRELWNNERALWLRRILKQEKSFPVCASCTELYRY